MKTNLIIFISTALSALVACKHETSNVKPLSSEVNVSNSLKPIDVSYTLKPRIKFKYTGPRPTDLPCMLPVGICIIYGIQAESVSYVFTEEDTQECIGTADVEILGDRIKLTPSLPFANDEGSVVLTGDCEMAPLLAQQYGYGQIRLLKGEYLVNWNEGKYGSVTIDIYAK